MLFARKPTIETAVPIGQALKEKGYVSQLDIESALDQQQETGDRVGEILVADGKVNYHRFYETLAEQLKLPFIDFHEEPFNKDLPDSADKHDYIEHMVFPWRLDEKNRVVLATCNISKALVKWADKRYGMKGYDLAMTSPYDIDWAIHQHFKGPLTLEATNTLSDNHPKSSAKWLSGARVSVVLGGLMALLAFAMINEISTALVSIYIVLNVFFMVTLLSKMLFFQAGAPQSLEKKIDKEMLTSLDVKKLPIYTILVPLFKETDRTIMTLIHSIRRLDYPKARLDVKLIVEENDHETIEAIKELKPENYFELIRVPYSLPQTKPKACNYALHFARGEYVTIYDAEDIPDTKQLKKALYMFENHTSDLGCVQSHLNYYNRKENWLTQFFAFEYGSWFRFMLHGLQRMELPIPLGGTSNHMPTALLRKLYAWDPHNVTEDADLGMRIAMNGYKVKVMDSLTLEEAPNRVTTWLNQRSRWVKGYMQTYLVHMRRPRHMIKTVGWRGFWGLQFFVGAPPLVFLSLPIMIPLSFVIFLQEYKSGIPDAALYLASFNVVLGVCFHIYFAVRVVWRHNWSLLNVFIYLFPFYWILHALASYKALWQLCVNPFYWEKTPHGVSKTMPKVMS